NVTNSKRMAYVKALESKNIVISYAPIIQIEGYKVSGYEVVLSWDGMAIAPDSTGQIIQKKNYVTYGNLFYANTELLEWVLSTSMNDIMTLNRKTNGDVFLSISISYENLYDKDFVKHLNDIITTLKFDPHQIEIGVIIKNADISIDRLRYYLDDMKKLGVRIALIDEGAGLSAFAYLEELDVETLCISNKNYTQGQKHLILSHLIELAYNYRRNIMVSNIQTEVALDFVRDLGPHYIKGTSVGRTLSHQELLC
nr:EAL domain-containing protein [Vallitaleaceae bacterium]